MKGWLQALVLLFCLSIHLDVIANGNEFAIVAHPSVSKKTISLESLRRIFSARQQFWPDGKRIRVVMQSSQQSLHQRFCSVYLHMFPYQIERRWNKMAYSGQGEAPIEVRSSGSVFDEVANTPGAIGYVRTQEQMPDNIIVLTIEQEQP